MKAILSALAVLLVIALFCWVNVLCLKTVTGNTSQLLKGALDAALEGSWQSAGAQCLKAQQYWEAHETYLGMVLVHSEFDEITTGFAPLSRLAELRNREDFAVEVTRAMALLEQIYDAELPKAVNLF